MGRKSVDLLYVAQPPATGREKWRERANKKALLWRQFTYPAAKPASGQVGEGDFLAQDKK